MIQLAYTGCDGSAWDLNSGQVFVDQRGIEGLGNPTWNRQVIESAGSDGQRRTGQRSRAKAREGYLPAVISAPTPAEWFALSAAWWNAWHPDTPGRLTVTAPGGTRFLDVCLKDDDSYAPTTDPSITGVESIGVHFVADQPFWQGALQNTIDLDEAGETGTTIALSNEGDLDAWPVYVMTGPFTSFTVLVGGTHRVSGAVDCPAGATVVLDTDPARQTAFLYQGAVATNVTPGFTAVDFAPILPGGYAAISGSVVGGGTIIAQFYPRFHRAW